MSKIEDLSLTNTLVDTDLLVTWNGGTRAIQAGDAATYFQTKIAGNFQPKNTMLTNLAGLGSTGVNNQYIVITGFNTVAAVSGANLLSNIGGQPVDPTLTALAGLTTSAGDYIEATGSDTFRVRKLTVATYAALTAIPAASRHDDMLVYVASRSADGDGGEGYWRFDAGSSATANGGTILAPDAGSGRWLRQYSGAVNVRWFGAVPGGAAATNTTAIQAAIDLVYAQTGGGTVEIVGNYDINAALIIGTNVQLRGAGRLTQTSDDTPIVKATKDTFNTGWSIRGVDMTYTNQQSASDTDARAIIVAEASKLSWSFSIEDLQISKAAKGIDAPEESNAFAFLATIRNVRLSQCSDWGLDWRNSITGASTFLTLENVWVSNQAGSEIAGSKGFRIKRCANLNALSIAVDHAQASPVVQFETCRGVVNNLGVESCDLTLSSGTARLVQVSGGEIAFGCVTLTGNVIDISGSADAIGLSTTDNANAKCEVLFDNSTDLTDTSSGSYFCAGGNSGTSLQVENFHYLAHPTRPAPNGTLADFATPSLVRLFDGNRRTDVRGGKTHTFGTAVPTSGTWVQGDTRWNTSPSSTTPVGWICVTGGTPGTWAEFGTPVAPSATAAAIAAVGNAINTTGKYAGKLVWDTTNTRMMRASGSAAADPWVVVDGSASVTPS